MPIEPSVLFDKLLLAVAIVSSIVGIYSWVTDKAGKPVYRWLFIILAIVLFIVYYLLNNDNKSGNSNTVSDKDTATVQKPKPEIKEEEKPVLPDNREKKEVSKQAVAIEPGPETLRTEPIDLLVIGSNNQLQDILQDIQTVFEKKGNTAISSAEEFTSVSDYKGKFKKLVVVHVQLNGTAPASLKENMITVNYSFSIKYYNAATGQLIIEIGKKGINEAGFKEDAIIEKIKTNIIDQTTSLL